MIPRFSIVGLSLLGALAAACRADRAPSSAAAYQKGSLACDTCVIQIEEVAVIGEHSPSAAFSWFTKLGSLPSGGLLFAPLGNRDRIAVADDQGANLTVLGRGGEGPGEFRRVIWATGDAGDTIVVLSLGRLTKLSPDGRLIRTGLAPNEVNSVHALAPNLLILTRYGAGVTPFVLLDDSFQQLGEVGEAAAVSDSNEYRVTSDRRGGFWAVRTALRYELKHYNSRGELTQSLLPTSEWFPATPFPMSGSNDPRAVRPLARVNGVALSSNGLLWVVAVVADEAWKRTAEPGRRGVELNLPPPTPLGFLDLYDSTIELLDPTTGRVVSSRRYGGLLSGITPEGVVHEILEDPVTGLIGVRLMRLSVGR